VGNNIRYKFQDTPVLEGLTIHETYNNILVLVATVSSVHRLSFPHPDKIHKQVHLAICVGWLLRHYRVLVGWSGLLL